MREERGRAFVQRLASCFEPPLNSPGEIILQLTFLFMIQLGPCPPIASIHFYPSPSGKTPFSVAAAVAAEVALVLDSHQRGVNGKGEREERAGGKARKMRR